MADANHVYNAGRARRIQVVLACLLAISYAPALSLGIRDPVYLK